MYYSDLTTNAGFGGVSGGAIYATCWNGSYWLIGGMASSGTARLVKYDGYNFTDLTSSLIGFSGTWVKTIGWNGSYFIVTGYNYTAINKYDGINFSDLSSGYPSCRPNAIAWNGSYWLLGGFGNRLVKYDGYSFTSLDSSLINFGGYIDNGDQWFDDYVVSIAQYTGGWLIGGATGQLNFAPSNLSTFTDLKSYVSSYIYKPWTQAGDILYGSLYVGWNGSYALIGSSKDNSSHNSVPVLLKMSGSGFAVSNMTLPISPEYSAMNNCPQWDNSTYWYFFCSLYLYRYEDGGAFGYETNVSSPFSTGINYLGGWDNNRFMAGYSPSYLYYMGYGTKTHTNNQVSIKVLIKSLSIRYSSKMQELIINHIKLSAKMVKKENFIFLKKVETKMVSNIFGSIIYGFCAQIAEIITRESNKNLVQLNAFLELALQKSKILNSEIICNPYMKIIKTTAKKVNLQRKVAIVQIFNIIGYWGSYTRNGFAFYNVRFLANFINFSTKRKNTNNRKFLKLLFFSLGSFHRVNSIDLMSKMEEISMLKIIGWGKRFYSEINLFWDIKKTKKLSSIFRISFKETNDLLCKYFKFPHLIFVESFIILLILKQKNFFITFSSKLGKLSAKFLFKNKFFR